MGDPDLPPPQGAFALGWQYGAGSRLWARSTCKTGSRPCRRTPSRASSWSGSSSASARQGEATLWKALPNTVAENRDLVQAFQAARENYRKMIEAAHRIRRKAELGGDGESLLEELARTEREFRPSAGGTTSALRCGPRQPKPSARRGGPLGGAAEPRAGSEEGS